jgi:uncharacterized protein YdiU (UPF0061 family)
MTPNGSTRWSNSYTRLPEHFFARVKPTSVSRPRLIQVNRQLADELALDLGTLDDDSLAALFAGNTLPPGAEPIAMAYAGHQFGQFVPQLGDGRAILLGEVLDRAGVRRDIQLKGSGRTPYSRNGDGRAALGPVLREYLLSEAMHALGVPATRALAAVTTGERVNREGSVAGAVFTRVAASHVRVGTFQYFAARADDAAVKRLADYVIARHYPAANDNERPYLALLQAIMQRQASLIAQWQQVGFIHGVMNTDNMAVSGETIDFGPCAFLDAYGSEVVFSSIDRAGRYAYGNQPYAAQWNLARLAETLLPLLDAQPDKALALGTEALATFLPCYAEHWLGGMRLKLGLFTAEDGDRQLIESLLEAMQANQADFTLTFRRLCDAAINSTADSQLRELFANPSGWDAWAVNWRARLTREPHAPAVRAKAMQGVNPAYIPRNHRVEQAIQAAAERDDYSLFTTLLQVLSRPFEAEPAFADYKTPPLPTERVLKTYCGT